MSAAQVLEQIERLPLEEQREVFEQLRDRFDDELTPEQIAELNRRAEEFRKNPDMGIPWEQVRDEARKRFGWK